jgi:hypothetical protein
LRIRPILFYDISKTQNIVYCIFYVIFIKRQKIALAFLFSHSLLRRIKVHIIIIGDDIMYVQSVSCMLFHDFLGIFHLFGGITIVSKGLLGAYSLKVHVLRGLKYHASLLWRMASGFEFHPLSHQLQQLRGTED